MTTFLVCLVIVLCLSSASARSMDDMEECQEACVPYHQVGYRCATIERNCFQKSSDKEIDACYWDCMATFRQCFELCDSNYEDIKVTCKASCKRQKSSFWGISCEDKCFEDEFKKESSQHLPNVTLPDVDIWQGVPLMDDDDSVEDDDLSISPREDSAWSMRSSEEDDIFGDWKKKRDVDWSWEDSSFGSWERESESWDDDVFGDKKKKRQTD